MHGMRAPKLMLQPVTRKGGVRLGGNVFFRFHVASQPDRIPVEGTTHAASLQIGLPVKPVGNVHLTKVALVVLATVALSLVCLLVTSNGVA